MYKLYNSYFVILGNLVFFVILGFFGTKFGWWFGMEFHCDASFGLTVRCRTRLLTALRKLKIGKIWRTHLQWWETRSIGKWKLVRLCGPQQYIKYTKIPKFTKKSKNYKIWIMQFIHNTKQCCWYCFFRMFFRISKVFGHVGCLCKTNCNF